MGKGASQAQLPATRPAQHIPYQPRGYGSKWEKPPMSAKGGSFSLFMTKGRVNRKAMLEEKMCLGHNFFRLLQLQLGIALGKKTAPEAVNQSRVWYTR